MFMDCVSLVGVIIPDSVQIIDENAFYGCVYLKNIGLPSSLTVVKKDAFAGCTSLEDVRFSGSDERFYSINFENGNDNLIIAYEAGK